jgi:hypothetical protein
MQVAAGKTFYRGTLFMGVDMVGFLEEKMRSGAPPRA